MKYEVAKTNRLGNRQINQDRAGIVETSEGLLLVVADGLGGTSGGEIASETAVNSVIRQFNNASRPLEKPDLFINQVIMRAHREVIAVSNAHQPPIQAKTTIVVCVVQNGFAYWGHVGDSRLYVIRGGRIVKQTIDDSKVEQLFQQGVISEAEKLTHPERNLITQCIGSNTISLQPKLSPAMALQKNDVLLLCTDGLWAALPEKEMIGTLDYPNFDRALEFMSRNAESASYPNSDNISAVGLRWQSENTQQEPKFIANTNVESDEIETELEEIVKQLENIVGKR